jgi:hypothetical protein
LAYKNTPFPKQYTILSNKWGAVHFAPGGLFVCNFPIKDAKKAVMWYNKR